MLTQHRFRDRAEAGRALAQRLAAYEGDANVIVLGLPRGGIPVAYEVARALRAPLDVFVVRKLGVPGHEELAMGAIASGGVTVFDPGIADRIPRRELNSVVATESAELDRREQLYRDHRPPQNPAGKTVILVDDGVATGASMQAAVHALRALTPQRIVVAVPVASRDACETMARVADEVVCVLTPERFYAVGQWYDNFSQITDDEVRALLERAAQDYATTHSAPTGDAQA
jgi:predicted phosphoribosyltransferase